MQRKCTTDPPTKFGEYEIDIPGIMGFDGIWWTFDGISSWYSGGRKLDENDPDLAKAYWFDTK